MEVIADEDNADALRRQLILVPAIQEEPVPDIPPAPVAMVYASRPYRLTYRGLEV